MKKPTWKMTDTEKTELAVKIITRVADNPDGVTIQELEADGIIAHSSMYFALCYQGFLTRVFCEGPAKFKIPDGTVEIDTSKWNKQPSGTNDTTSI